MMLVRAALHAALNARLSDGSPVLRYRHKRISSKQSIFVNECIPMMIMTMMMPTTMMTMISIGNNNNNNNCENNNRPNTDVRHLKLSVKLNVRFKQ